ncbi:phosphatase PAP2 family protein [bacterium]|nr:phosphatase PAP2 family protein [bacterium]
MKFIFILILISLMTYYSYGQTAETPKEIRIQQRVEKIGDLVQIALPTAAAITTIALKDWVGSKQFFYSFTATVITTHSLKYLIRKKRPGQSNQYNAFPSGHTSAAFQGAAFIQRRYGWNYGLPAYCIAAFVGYSRIENNRHDIWDILGGAALGIGTVYLLTSPYQSDQLRVSAFSDGKQHLLMMSCQF